LLADLEIKLRAPAGTPGRKSERLAFRYGLTDLDGRALKSSKHEMISAD
jgi:hypothetical protein